MLSVLSVLLSGLSVLLSASPALLSGFSLLLSGAEEVSTTTSMGLLSAAPLSALSIADEALRSSEVSAESEDW